MTRLRVERLRPLASLTVVCLVFAGCDSTDPGTDDLIVTITTTGPSQDPDGYQIELDQEATGTVSANGRLKVRAVAPGVHALRVRGIARNCDLAGDNPRVISIVDSPSPIALAVQCRLALEDGLVFVSNRSGRSAVYTIASDGTGLVELNHNSTVNDADAEVSPDGTRIVFTEAGGLREIFVMDVDGGNTRNLTNDPGDDLDPTWSPDGSKVAFQSYRNGVYESYAMNSDGSGVVRLTYTEYVDGPVSWSPDGTRLAIVIQSPVDDASEIVLVGADGAGATNLSRSPAIEFDPQWSPDGSHILCVSDRDGNYEVYSIEVSTGTALRLTTNSGIDTYPRWSPDGRQILFLSNRNGQDDLYIMNQDGSNPLPVTNTADQEIQPGWTSDGARVVFVDYSLGNYEIFVIDPDGSHRLNLTNNPADDFGWSWAPRL